MPTFTCTSAKQYQRVCLKSSGNGHQSYLRRDFRSSVPAARWSTDQRGSRGEIMTTETREDEDCSCPKVLRLFSGNLARACALAVVLLATAAAHAATSGSSNVVITVTPGQSVAVTVTPA